MSNIEKNKRPEKDITTSFGKNVVRLKEWITVSEFEEVTAIFKKAASDVKIDGKSQTAELNGGDVSSLMEAEEEARHKAFELVVVSIDGKTDDLYSLVKNSFRMEDAYQIFAAVDEILSPKKKEE